MPSHMELIPIEEIAKWLRTVDVVTVAKETKISFAALYNIRRGANGCTYKTLSTLSAYIAQQRSV